MYIYKCKIFLSILIFTLLSIIACYCMKYNIEYEEISAGNIVIVVGKEKLIFKNKEEVVQKAIENYLSDSTILSIAHRIKTIKNMDRILVLDEGKVVEYDKPDVLLKNNNSIFYKLYYNANMEYLH